MGNISHVNISDEDKHKDKGDKGGDRNSVDVFGTLNGRRAAEQLLLINTQVAASARRPLPPTVNAIPLLIVNPRNCGSSSDIICL